MISILVLIIVIIFIFIKAERHIKILTIIIISTIIIGFIGFRFYFADKVNNNLIEENKIISNIESEYNENIEGYYIIRTYEELEEFIELKSLNVSIFSKFNENFFRNYDLIVYIHSTHEGISQIYTSNEELIIVMYNPGSVRLSTEITNIEIEKKSIKEVSLKWENDIWWWKIFEFCF